MLNSLFQCPISSIFVSVHISSAWRMMASGGYFSWDSEPKSQNVVFHASSHFLAFSPHRSTYFAFWNNSVSATVPADLWLEVLHQLFSEQVATMGVLSIRKSIGRWGNKHWKLRLCSQTLPAVNESHWAKTEIKLYQLQVTSIWWSVQWGEWN